MYGILQVWLTILVRLILLSPTQGFDYTSIIQCEGETWTHACDAGFVHVFNSANYGRMSSEPCRGLLFNSRNCQSSTSLDKIHGYCFVQQTCEIPVTNGVFSDTCFGSKKYLEFQYACVPDVSLYAMCASLGDIPKDGFIITPNYPVLSQDVECIFVLPIANDISLRVIYISPDVSIALCGTTLNIALTTQTYMYGPGCTNLIAQTDYNFNGTLSFNIKLTGASKVLLEVHDIEDDVPTTTLSLPEGSTSTVDAWRSTIPADIQSLNARSPDIALYTALPILLSALLVIGIVTVICVYMKRKRNKQLEAAVGMGTVSGERTDNIYIN